MLTTITVRAIKTSRVKQVEFKTTHLWYDTVEKKMHKFYGGQLKFEPDAVTGRMLPRVEPLLIGKRVQHSSIWRIREWFEENAPLYRLTKVEDTPTHLSFVLSKEAEESDIEAVENALYRERFDYRTEKHAQGQNRS